MRGAGDRATVESAGETDHIRSRELPRILENDRLRVAVAPLRGGKIVSLLSKRTDTEWLLPPLRAYAEAVTTAGFEAGDGGGFDECLPTVAATPDAPDHGELWRHPWHEEASECGVVLRTSALGNAIGVERHARLDEESLILDYRISNQSDGEQRLLYCAHPLLRVEQGDRILLPKQITKVRIEGSSSDRLGGRGDVLAWPRLASGEDISMVGPPDGLQADKLLAGPMAEGWCALFRPALDEGIEITFSNDVLPWVGIWISRAAWPDSGNVKQYTVALEPTSAPHDSLEDAERDGSAWLLKPGESRSWILSFRLVTQQDIDKHAAGERR